MTDKKQEIRNIHKFNELIDDDNVFLNKIFDDIFGFRNFLGVMKCFTYNEIIELMLTYNSQLEFTKISSYLKQRIDNNKLISHFEKLSVGGEQTSKDWHSERKKRITASSISIVLSGKLTKTYLNLIYEKISDDPSRFTGSPATENGKMFEPVAREIYSMKTHVKVYEFGLIPHKKYDFIGASPDGITESGVLLEIKCPYSRNITNFIPKSYYSQIQHQLETCDCDTCHYVECIFKSMNEKEWYDTFVYDSKSYRGVVLELFDKSTCERHYKYSDLFTNIKPIKKKINRWIRSLSTNTKNYTYSSKYWILEGYDMKLVKRETNWFENAFPKMLTFIEYVRKYQDKKEMFCSDFEYEPKWVIDKIPSKCVL